MTETPKKLYRSTSDRMVSGVCGGLGQYLNLDPTVIRLTFVLLTVFGFGSAAPIYLIMMLIIPEEPGATNVQAAADDDQVVEGTARTSDEA